MTQWFSFCHIFGTEIAAHKHTGTDTGSQCHTNEHIGQCCTGTDSCKCRRTNKLADNNGVGHIVYLLKKTSKNHRHCKNRQRFEGRIGYQILIFRHALISCVVSVFLVLLVDPVLAVRCLIVYLAVQFVENQFIYPRVVGKSVGLSPLYTLVAAMIGGKLFGIIGIIFFIPLTAVVIELVKEDACRRLRAKEPLQ